MGGLLDFMKGANDAAASTLYGPVDLLSLALRKAGLPMPDDQNVPGSKAWLQSKGLLHEAPVNRASAAGQTLGLLSPIVAQAKAPQISAGLLRMIDNAHAPGAMNAATRNQAGAIVWHGSPHKFDKFDSTKIGTGEGRNQQGVGGYFAQAKEVAQKYADKESAKRGMDSGFTYKIDMPDDMMKNMASYEDPVAIQSKNVQAAIARVLNDDAKTALKNYHGWDAVDEAPFAAVLDAVEIASGNNRAAAADAFRRAGIPGIRYLDGGSRTAGAGSSNFVVFPGNEGLLSILERNGVPINGK